MEIAFYTAGIIALFSTIRVITHVNAVHALLYMVLSLLSVALIFFTLGAPFIAALEVIIYAGAIMVLFVFAVMMLNLGPQSEEQERQWIGPKAWRAPVILGIVLLSLLIYSLILGEGTFSSGIVLEPRQVSLALFGPYLLAVELAAFLLLAGLVGAFHLGRR